MVFNRAVSIVLALTVPLSVLTPARAEVGECDNKPGNCQASSRDSRRQFHAVPRPAPAARYERHEPLPQYRPRYDDRRDGNRHRDNDGDRLARAIALGVGAAIIGGILASGHAHAADRD